MYYLEYKISTYLRTRISQNKESRIQGRMRLSQLTN